MQLRVIETVVRIQLAKGVLGEEHVGGWAISWVAVFLSVTITITITITTKRGTYTVKQSNIKAIAIGVISSLISSGIGGVSPFAIL